jgi:hypothetical protein
LAIEARPADAPIMAVAANSNLRMGILLVLGFCGRFCFRFRRSPTLRTRCRSGKSTLTDRGRSSHLQIITREIRVYVKGDAYSGATLEDMLQTRSNLFLLLD